MCHFKVLLKLMYGADYKMTYKRVDDGGHLYRIPRLKEFEAAQPPGARSIAKVPSVCQPIQPGINCSAGRQNNSQLGCEPPSLGQLARPLGLTRQTGCGKHIARRVLPSLPKELDGHHRLPGHECCSRKDWNRLSWPIVIAFLRKPGSISSSIFGAHPPATPLP